MAIVPMANAVPGNVALAAEYNKVVSNVVDLDARTTLVEAAVGGGTGEVPRKGGEWQFGASTQALPANTATLLTAWTAVGTPSGVSHSGGVFTLTEGGLYVVSASYRTAFVSGAFDKYIFVAGSGTTDTWFKNSAGGQAFNMAVSGVRRVAAGSAVRIYAYSTVATTLQREAAGDFCTGVSIYKIGN